MSPRPLDKGIPGGVYLCQVGDTVSCGACCGLYNVADPSPGALEAMLKRRSADFAGVDRTMAGILDFKASVERREDPSRPFADFHHCPYIGLIGPDQNRVGCLLHPLAHGNNGIDFRGLSYYGGMACRVYFCPATKRLPARWKRILRAAADHWYTYGLLVTERALIQSLFTALEKRIGTPATLENLNHVPQGLERIRRLFRIKLDWPHGARSTVCNYFFEDGCHPDPPVIYAEDCPPSPNDAFFKALHSRFPNHATLEAAEQAVEEILTDLARAFRTPG